MKRLLMMAAAMTLVATMAAGSAEAAGWRSHSMTRAFSTLGPRPVPSGYPSYFVLELLRYWKTGMRYEFFKF